jgi:pilus assembly protein CpaB
LILLIGVFLAIVAFIGIVLLLSQPGPTTDGDGGTAVKVTIVVAKVDIPLGTIVTAEMISEQQVDATQADATRVQSKTLAIGRVARRNILTGQQLLNADFSGGGSATDVVVPPGKRGISLQVDQITGVGTLIQPGDYVDVVVGLTSSSFPVVSINPADQSVTVVQGLNGTSVKLILQNLQVLNTLLPPQQTTADGTPATSGGTALTGQQEIVIVAGTASQMEVLKFVQLDASVSLVLRSAFDYQDRDADGDVILPVDEITDGVILKSLIDKYGVLTPQLIEAILPAPAQ